MTDFDPAFMKEIFDIPQRSGKRMYSNIARRMISGDVLK
jgi:hypothetical protein